MSLDLLGQATEVAKSGMVWHGFVVLRSRKSRARGFPSNEASTRPFDDGG